MLNSKIFKKGDLKVCDTQYQVNFDSTLYFNINDIVFLKSNPEFPLKVVDVDLDNVYCVDKNDKKYKFIPQIILHYKWASLLILKRKWKISLN